MKKSSKLLIALACAAIAMGSSRPAQAEVVYNDCDSHCCWTIYKLPVQGHDYCVLTYTDCGSGVSSTSNCVN